MALSIALLHKRPEYLKDCCDLINDEWKRSETARMRSLENSCDSLPANIILLDNERLIGHLKLSVIPSDPEACFVETVVIERQLRGRGYGSKIMEMSEEYCKECLGLKRIYLSTRGQENFYRKLGYDECPPISIFGFSTNVFRDLPPPPGTFNNKINMKYDISARPIGKTYMVKNL